MLYTFRRKSGGGGERKVVRLSRVVPSLLLLLLIIIIIIITDVTVIGVVFLTHPDLDAGRGHVGAVVEVILDGGPRVFLGAHLCGLEPNPRQLSVCFRL